MTPSPCCSLPAAHCPLCCRLCHATIGTSGDTHCSSTQPKQLTELREVTQRDRWIDVCVLLSREEQGTQQPRYWRNEKALLLASYGLVYITGLHHQLRITPSTGPLHVLFTYWFVSATQQAPLQLAGLAAGGLAARRREWR